MRGLQILAEEQLKSASPLEAFRLVQEKAREGASRVWEGDPCSAQISRVGHCSSRSLFMEELARTDGCHEAG